MLPPVVRWFLYQRLGWEFGPSCGTIFMASALQIPDTFKRSYENFAIYPRNLVQHVSYPAALEAYATRLEDASRTLFVRNEQDVHVPFRDFTGQCTCLLSAEWLIDWCWLFAASLGETECPGRWQIEGQIRRPVHSRSNNVDSCWWTGDEERSKMPFYVSLSLCCRT